MTVGEIQGHLAISSRDQHLPDLISRVTDAVLDEVREWQSRPLDLVYPIVFFDALRVKIRDEGLVKNKAVYVALASTPTARKRSGSFDRADRGRKVLAEGRQRAQTRGVNDILIAVVDGLKGFPEAITTVFRRPWFRPALFI